MDCKVSVGIATLNGASRVDALLASIKKSTPDDIDYGICVIDDGSTERNLIFLRELCRRYGADLGEHRTNQGISETWNHLTERYKSEYVVLLNDDVEVKPGWLQSIVGFIEHNDKVGTVGLHPLRDGKIVACGGGTLALDHPDAAVPHRVVAANGYCFGFRKSLWELAGKFDEGFVSFYEEVDFGVRCWRLGYQSFNVPWPVIEHEWSSTFQQNDQLLLPKIQMELSRKRFLLKWGSDMENVVTNLKKDVPAPSGLWWLTEGGPREGKQVVEVLR